MVAAISAWNYPLLIAAVWLCPVPTGARHASLSPTGHCLCAHSNLCHRLLVARSSSLQRTWSGVLRSYSLPFRKTGAQRARACLENLAQLTKRGPRHQAHCALSTPAVGCLLVRTSQEFSLGCWEAFSAGFEPCPLSVMCHM